MSGFLLLKFSKTSSSCLMPRHYPDTTTLQKKLNNTDYIFSFMIDDICFSVMKQDSFLTCPKHGEQPVHRLAPDLAFEDIEDRLIISQNILTIEGLLGRGSFGFVYAGFLDLKNSPTGRKSTNVGKMPSFSRSLTFENFNKVKVAIKVLESVGSVGQGDNSSNKEYNMDKSGDG